MNKQKAYAIRESLSFKRILYRAISNRKLPWYIQNVRCLKTQKVTEFSEAQLLGTGTGLSQNPCLLPEKLMRTSSTGSLTLENLRPLTLHLHCYHEPGSSNTVSFNRQVLGDVLSEVNDPGLGILALRPLF